MRAQGEARSAELIGEAVKKNKGFLQLRRLEAARDIANILATSGNRVMLDSQSLLLNGTPRGHQLESASLKFTHTYSYGRRKGFAQRQQKVILGLCM